MPNFVRGDKVVHIPTNELFDFGYIGNTGKAIVYLPGECNMQDAHAVDPKALRKYNPSVDTDVT